MSEDLSNNKRSAASPKEKEPPNKQKCGSGSLSSVFGDNEQNEVCQNNVKSHHVSDTSENNQGLTEIQPEECSAVEQGQGYAPGPIQFTSVKPNSISLIWGPPEGHTGPQKFKVTWKNGDTGDSKIVTDSNTCTFSLFPGEKYDFTVVTLGEDQQSKGVTTATTYTDIPAPEELQIKRNGTTAQVTWRKPEGLDQVEYVLSLCKEGNGSEEKCLRTITTTSEKCLLPDLELNMKYIVRVSFKLTNGCQGKATRYPIPQAVPALEQLTVSSVTPTSAEITWSPPHGIDQTLQSYQISYYSRGTEPQTISADSCSTVITGLRPCTKYNVSVFTELKDGGMSEPVTTDICTAVPYPQKLKAASVTPTSIHLIWSPPHGMEETPDSYQISYHSGEPESKTISSSSDSCSTVIANLMQCTHYGVSICTKLKDGRISEPMKTVIRTAPPVPEQLTVGAVTATTVHLTWSQPHGMDQTPHSYQISYQSRGTEPLTISADSCSTVIGSLKPLTDYDVRVSTKLPDNGMSEAVRTEFRTAVPSPEQLTVSSVTPASAEITWSPPHGIDQTPHSYQITYYSGGTEPQTISADSCRTVITGLRPCTNYNISVCTELKDGGMSEPATTAVCTAPPVPEQLTVGAVTATTVHLTWSQPHGMDQTPHSYQISYHSGGTKLQTISTDSCKAVITGLKPGTNYNVRVCTKLNDGRMSEATGTQVQTDIPTKKFYTIVIGNTQNHHQALKRMLTDNHLAEVHNVKSCDSILAFCVIVSRVGTDMEAALKEIPDSKPVVLVVMHHTFNHDHVTPDTSRFVRGRKITVIDILFHEDQGILRCQKNNEAQRRLLNEFDVSPESDTIVPASVWENTKHQFKSFRQSFSLTNESRSPTDPRQHNQQNSYRFPPDGSSSTAAGGSQSVPRPDLIEATMCSRAATSSSSKNIKYFTILSGNTLKCHAEIQKRLTDKGVLQAEVSSVEKCDVLLVFCPVVSSFGSDIDKAYRSIPKTPEKPAVVVVMHHTFDPDYLHPCNNTNNRKETLVVHCLFYEDIGLLKSSKNDDAISRVTKWLCEMFPQMAAQNVQNSSMISLPTISMPSGSIRNVFSYFRK